MTAFFIFKIQVYEVMRSITVKQRKTSFEKTVFFCVGEYAEYGFDQQRLIWYVFRQWDMVFS